MLILSTAATQSVVASSIGGSEFPQLSASQMVFRSLVLPRAVGGFVESWDMHIVEYTLHE